MKTVRFQTPGAIIAGNGCFSEVSKQIIELGKIKSILIVTSPSIVRQGFATDLLNSMTKVGIASKVISGVMREPTVQHIEELHEQLDGQVFDVFIGLGGGSVLDVTKLLAVLSTGKQMLADIIGIDRITSRGVPTILIPTTSGTGSEVTPNAIVTVPEEQLKIGVVSQHLYAAMVFVDPELTLSLPPAITAATGMDAFTHALESFISNKANPISDMFALESIRLLSKGMVEAYHNGQSLQARESMLYGSVYGGMALACSGTAAVHALAYPLGGRFNVTHGVANAMLLPHVMAFQLAAIAPRLDLAANAMGLSDKDGAEQVLQCIINWTAQLHIPQNLRDFGVTPDDIGELAIRASQVTRLLNNNPKALSITDMESIYRKLL
ncbi:iron-containing alcohol dehydrogenase [Paenibacillus psychroresistens]|uniref:Iron-containing alcohol dehydrogenase n=1 Tax=Paenibacillus psychroresistens TaxID=1778678 RepID=A0A6B8RSQ0_9BACL|nr:iron-containing alcohol dehydrogenase [Paenibacillus psychroresistens]QGQ99471.1 iron-containing alcohol dehydrogenase [Paenibacillus psychroresistens]